MSAKHETHPAKHETHPAKHETDSWIDRWFWVGVALFGVAFVSLLALFHPHY